MTNEQQPQPEMTLQTIFDVYRQKDDQLITNWKHSYGPLSGRQPSLDDCLSMLSVRQDLCATALKATLEVLLGGTKPINGQAVQG